VAGGRCLLGSDQPVREPTADPAVLDSLTRREREVLTCLGEGLSHGEIAARLDMAEATVKTHVSRLPGKLELRSRVQTAVPAQELGIRPGCCLVVQTY
jgi:DNA-binding NarL/FixJ family response regulator